MQHRSRGDNGFLWHGFPPPWVHASFPSRLLEKEEELLVAERLEPTVLEQNLACTMLEGFKSEHPCAHSRAPLCSKRERLHAEAERRGLD